MKVAIAADHAGYELKEKLKDHLKREGHEVIDMGGTSFHEGDDYPDFAAPAAEMVATGRADRAVVICDTGIGVDIVANKIPGIRSALVHNEELARRTREHNDSNVLALGAMLLEDDTAKRIVKTWLDTDFTQAERHERRIGKITKIDRERKGTSGPSAQSH